MKNDWISAFRHPAAQYFFGGIALIAVTFVAFRLGFSVAAAGFVYLVLIALLALMGSIIASLIFSIVAGLCLNYFFTPPIFSLGVENAEDVLSILAFLTTSILVNGLIAVRKRAEAAVREQASLLNLTHDSIFVRDMRNVITYWNRGAEDFYGWTAAEVVGKATTHQLLRTAFPAPLEEIDAELLSTGHWEGELVHTKADGARVVVASRWSLQRDEQQQPFAILELNNDITGRKRAEEKLQQAVQAELTHLARVTTLGELTASIAHEVNQPLAGVVANAEACLLWLDGTPPILDEARRSMEWIIKDGNRAGEVIGRIRALSKKAESQKVPLRINDAVNEAIALVQRELFNQRIALRMELAPTLPEVLADRIELQQVIINLLINGIEAMQPVSDRPRELVIRSLPDHAHQVLVTVQDCGVGISSENAGRLFDAFFTTKSAGMGMGLSICRSIIAAHGGRLWAEPNLPHGATFHFTLPSHQEDAP
jgi:two-component system sensor kinase FixL